MQSRRIAVILNATAGSASDSVAQQIAEHFSARGVNIVLRVVDGATLGAATREALEQGASVVAAGGGDGTISAVASILADTDADLGVLPLGTLNHFAKDLDIPLGTEDAVNTIVEGHTTTVDVGEVNGRLFINNSSLGVYPSVVTERERERRKGHPKVLSLAMALVRVWKRYPLIVVTLRVDGSARTVRTPFVFVGNGKYTLEGINLTRRERLSDGLVHICLAPNISRGEGVRMVAAALFGRLHQVEYFVEFFDTSLLVEAPRAVAVSLDGEVAVLQSPLHYRVRPKALRVIVPASPAAAQG
jgi:YegS/Rv2252/BmrU family lipid kinase